MRVYISCHAGQDARELAAKLTAAGHAVVSSWHESHEPRPDMHDGAAWAKNAERNLKEIDSAEALVLIASDDHVAAIQHVRGGKFVETGYALNHALGSGGPLVVTLGGVENGMLYHPAVRHVVTPAELIDLLAAGRSSRPAQG